MKPEGWATVRLGDVTTPFEAGVSVNSEDRLVATGEHGVLKTSAVTYGRFNPHAHKTILRDEVARARVNPRRDHIIISRMNTQALVGASAYIPEDFLHLFLPDRLWQTTALDLKRLHTKWLAHLLGWAKTRASISALATGTSGSMKNLSKERLCDLELQLPPLLEQRKIAAILSSVDDAIDRVQAVLDQVRVVKNALTHDLFTRGLPGRHTRFKMTEIGEVPEEWEVVRVEDVCSVITKGATPCAQTRDTGEVPFFKVYNINPQGFVDFTYQPTFIPRSVHQGELRRSRVVPGDVLMNIVGPPLGKVAVVSDAFPEANVNQAIAVFRPARVESAFLEACLSAPGLFAWAVSRAKRTSTQLNLTLEICRDYPIPLPPPTERQAVLALIGATTERVQSELRSLDALRKAKAALISVLLSGEVRVTFDEATP